MKKSQVIAAALIVYLAIALAGGAAYFVLSHPEKVAALTEKFTQKSSANAASASAQEEKHKEQETKAEGEAKASKTVEEKARREVERQKGQQEIATKEARAKATAEDSALRASRMESLIATMTVKKKASATFYRYIYDTYPESGVYLRPFLADGGGFVVLKCDIYYYSSLEGGDYRWVYGDRLDIIADGVGMTLHMDASKRRDRLGKGAENLTESYVYDADKETANVLRAIGNSGDVWINYVNSATGAVSGRSLGREELRRIRNMLELYDLFMQEYT